MTKEEILAFLRQKKSYLRRQFGVVSIALFGSYARGEADESSDIDLAVEIESPNRFRSFFALKYYLEEQLQKRVNLGVESTLKPIAKAHAQKEMIRV